MKKFVFQILFLVALSACSDGRTVLVDKDGREYTWLTGSEVGVVTTALGTDYYPTLTDENTVNGSCSLREAVRAANSNTAVDTCPAGLSGATNMDVIHLSAGTFSATIAGQDDTAATGDLDVGDNLKIVGDSMSTTIIDMNQLDRAFHIKGNVAFELSDLTIREGCANSVALSATCAADVAGSISSGGGFYHNSAGRLRVDRVRIESSGARQGAGFSICAAISPDAVVSDVEIVGNTAVAGGGGIDAHVNWTLQDSLIENNIVSSTNGTGAGMRQWDRILTSIDNIIRNNVSQGSGGGIAAVGAGGGVATSTINMVGGELTNNSANASGGNVFVNAGTTGTALYNVPCGAAGCLVSLEDVVVTSGDADSPSTPPNGSGGNLMTNTSSSAPGRLELRGTTDVSGGSDPSSPVAVDCSGAVTLYDQSDIADTTGCTVTDLRPPPGPVCGNDEVEEGEECDADSDCCVDCLFAEADSSCEDGNACTVGDTCNSTGSCIAGSGTTCGDGTVNCGEECDDANTSSNDGCSASCHTEMCVAWE